MRAAPANHDALARVCGTRLDACLSPTRRRYFASSICGRTSQVLRAWAAMMFLLALTGMFATFSGCCLNGCCSVAPSFENPEAAQGKEMTSVACASPAPTPRLDPMPMLSFASVFSSSLRDFFSRLQHVPSSLRPPGRPVQSTRCPRLRPSGAGHAVPGWPHGQSQYQARLIRCFPP